MLQTRRRPGIGRVLMAAIVIAVIGVSGVAYYAYQAGNQKPDQVSLILNFTPTYNHMIFYYGLDQGIFAKNGIDLTIEPGSSRTSDSGAIALLAAGRAQFALAETTALIVDQQNSTLRNVRVVGVVYQREFFSIYFNKAVIQNITDLNGKAGGGNNPATSSQAQLFFLLAKLNGVNASTLKMTYGTSSVTTPLFVSGKLQFVLRPLDSFGDIQAAAAKNGIQVGNFPFEAYGIDTYGSELLTTTQMISQNPDLVQRMVLATEQSIAAAVKDPAGAAAALVKYEPQLNQTSALEGMKLLTNCCLKGANSTANPLSYGWIDPAQMQHTVNLVVTGLGIKASVNATDLYTDQFTQGPS